MKTPHQKRIEKFMKLAKQNLPEVPTMPDEKTRVLRAKLIFEEALETIKALGCTVEVVSRYTMNEKEYDSQLEKYRCYFFDSEGLKEGIFQVENDTAIKADLSEIADGCADISVVTIGTLSACGIPDKDLLEMVDENNLAKFGPGSYIDETGKLRKPPGHQPPPIKELIEKLMNQGKKTKKSKR